MHFSNSVIANAKYTLWLLDGETLEISSCSTQLNGTGQRVGELNGKQVVFYNDVYGYVEISYGGKVLNMMKWALTYEHICQIRKDVKIARIERALDGDIINHVW